MSSLVLLIIFTQIRPSSLNVSFLLICNTYFTIIIFCFTLFDIGGHSLYGHINLSIVFAGQWCEIRAYFSHVCFCSYYYSFVLQAIFRLFRIVFYKKKILQSFHIFLIAIFMQWFLSFIFILPHIFLKDFQYQSIDYNCWISFKNIRGMLLAILNIYVCPLLIIFIIYAYILKYIRQKINIQQKRRKANRRNIIILRRIIIILIFLIIIGIPTLIILLIYIITNYLIPFAYDIQTINISLGLVITSITLVFVTPRLRHMFRQNNLHICRKSIERTMTSSSQSRQLTDNV